MRKRLFVTALRISGPVLALAQVITSTRTAQDNGDGGVSAFYQADRVPSAPGELIRRESLPAAMTLTNAARSQRVLYTATNGISDKGTIAVSGMVMLPKGAKPPTGWPVVAWAHGTTGVADVCAPSWASTNPRTNDYLNKWLAEAYGVVATDYQGLGTPGPHPWMTVRPHGYSVLDSVRAALKAFPELANSVRDQHHFATLACAAGSVVERHYYPGVDHSSTAVAAQPDSIPFVRSVLAGRAVTNTCATLAPPPTQ